MPSPNLVPKRNNTSHAIKLANSIRITRILQWMRPFGPSPALARNKKLTPATATMPNWIKKTNTTANPDWASIVPAAAKDEATSIHRAVDNIEQSNRIVESAVEVVLRYPRQARNTDGKVKNSEAKTSPLMPAKQSKATMPVRLVMTVAVLIALTPCPEGCWNGTLDVTSLTTFSKPEG